LERKFGTLIPGQSFGESFMLGASSNNRFFNVIALTDCVLLTLTKKDYDTALSAIDKRIYQEKRDFLKVLPALQPFTFSSAKSKQLCGGL